MTISLAECDGIDEFNERAAGLSAELTPYTFCYLDIIVRVNWDAVTSNT